MLGRAVHGQERHMEADQAGHIAQHLKKPVQHILILSPGGKNGVGVSLCGVCMLQWCITGSHAQMVYRKNVITAAQDTASQL